MISWTDEVLKLKYEIADCELWQRADEEVEAKKKKNKHKNNKIKCDKRQEMSIGA